jgi:hypothetical protein
VKKKKMGEGGKEVEKGEREKVVNIDDGDMWVESLSTFLRPNECGFGSGSGTEYFSKAKSS